MSPAEDVATRFIAAHDPDKRALLTKLRALVVKNVPAAKPVIKWGVPIYELDGKKICALGSFKDSVGINFFAPPAVLADPSKKLQGEGKGNRMLKVRTAADIDAASITRWLKAAAAASK